MKIKQYLFIVFLICLIPNLLKAQSVTLSTPSSSSTQVDNAVVSYTVSDPAGAPQAIQVVFTCVSGPCLAGSFTVMTLNMKAAFLVSGSKTFTAKFTDLNSASNDFTPSPAGVSLQEGVYTAFCQYVRPASAGGTTLKSTTRTNILFDVNTQTPIILSPVSGQLVGSSFIFKDTIPEAYLSGSKTLKIIGSSITNTVIMKDNVRKDSFNMRTDSLIAPANITSTSYAGYPSIPDGIYNFELSYQDRFSHPVATTTISNVTVQSKTPKPTLISPINDTIFRRDSFAIRYTIPALMSAGTGMITFSPGGYSFALPNVIGTNNYFVNSNMPDGNYKVKISYQDTLKNPASSDSTNLIIARTVSTASLLSPVNAATYGSNSTFLLRDTIIGYNKALTKTLNIMSGATVVSSILLYNTQSDSIVFNLRKISESAAKYISRTGLDSLPDGVYDFKLTYTDSYGGTSTSSATAVNFTTVTTVPIIAQPTTGLVNVNGMLPINYTLPKAALAGSVKLTISKLSGTTFTNVLTMIDTSPGATIFLNLNNFAAAVGTVPFVSIAPGFQNAGEDGNYRLSLSYQDVLANPVATTSVDFKYQKYTLAPKILAPINGATLSNQFNYSDSLTETLGAGTKLLTISNDTQSWLITLKDLQKSAFSLNFRNLDTSRFIATHTNSASIPDGNYKMKLSYQNANLSTVAVDSVNVIIDSYTQPPVIISPTNSANIGNQVNLSFQIPETPIAGSGQIIFSSTAKSDTIVVANIATGLNNLNLDLRNLTTNPALASSTSNTLDSGLYSIAVLYKDLLNNTAQSTSITNIYLGNATPSITTTGAIRACFGDSLTLTSNALHGNKWYLNYDATPIDTNVVIKVAEPGIYTLRSSFNGAASSAYLSRMSLPIVFSIKQVPNSPNTQNISYYVQDTISTALTAEASTGNTLRWYGTNAIGGSFNVIAPIPRTAIAGSTNYYVTQFNAASGCESNRAALVVTTVPLPAGVNKNGKVGSKEVLQSSGKLIQINQN